MKLELQINSRAINDTSRSLEGSGIAITPPIDEAFWLMRVPLSEKQAIVAFPKFGTIGVGFQVEEDWNTNLPAGTHAIEIFDHIKRNKGDSKIPRHRCIEAIQLIQEAVLKMRRTTTIAAIKGTLDQTKILDELGAFLRLTGNHEVAQSFGR